MLACLLLLVEDEQREAITHIYESYKRLVWTTTGRFFAEEDRRWEAFQRSWLRVVQYAQKIVSLSCDILPGYLVIMVKNECKRLLAEDKRYALLPEDPEELERLLADQAPDPAALWERRETVERETALIGDLPEPYCTVLEMRLVLGWSNKATAQALGITQSKASTWFSRGMERLKKSMGKEGLGCE